MKRVNRSKRKKVSTMLDAEALMTAKMAAANERKRTTSVVLQTYGTLKIDPKSLQRILDEEPGVLEV